jgi:hypothetical protein
MDIWHCARAHQSAKCIYCENAIFPTWLIAETVTLWCEGSHAASAFQLN